MMTSNLLSRFRQPLDPAAASIYETIRRHDEDSGDSDLEERAGLGAGPQSAARPRTDSFPSLTLTESPVSPDQHDRRMANVNSRAGNRSHRRSKSGRKISHPRSNLVDVEEINDDVPASLLIEGPDGVLDPIDLASPPRVGAAARHQRRRAQSQWDHARAQQQVHPAEAPPPGASDRGRPGINALAAADPREKAMWRWANVQNLDNFLGDVYDYYLGRGFWSILLRRFFNLITVAFVVGFSLFLTQCINYRSIKGATEISQILVPRCTARMGFVPNAVLWLATFIWISKVFQYAVDVRRLKNMHDFYHFLLGVPEAEIQSISWQEVVSRLMALRDSNPNIMAPGRSKAHRFLVTQSKQRMDAHDIANRLMRKDNYMIAMINKEVLDMTLPVPFLGQKQLFTRTLEWHINQCIMDYVFNDHGQVRQLFLKDTHRKALSEGLRRRFVFAGTANLIVSPFLIVYFLVQNFFQYFNEYQKNPSQIGSRQYTIFAEWKFREFNELWHLFDRRLRMSHPFAMRYINQFPKDKTVQAARFVTFVSGAIISVLGLATVLDQENFLGFEVTPGRTTIFYLGIFGSVWAVARGLLPDDTMVYDSSYSMEEVMDFTHYRPAQWEGRLHTVEVKTEFSQLYQMQIVILLEEMLSMVFTPFVLWFSLPKCSDRIIDFFREFTVHVDGLGYVCSFAEFNFRKSGQTGHPPANAGTRTVEAGPTVAAARDEYFASKDHKLEQSYWGFMNDYARNPKTDVRFPYSSHGGRKRPLTMPPPFPGLPSPSLRAKDETSDHRTPANVALSPRRATGGPSEAPPVGARPKSPFQSLLLDPHHLPGTGGVGVRSPPALRPTGGKWRGHLSTRSTLDQNDTLEEVDDGADDGVQRRVKGKARLGSTTATAMGPAGGGDLGSWKYDGDDDDDDDDDDGSSDSEEDLNTLTGDGRGVVGLIKQFQKAQGEGARGGGIGM